LRGEASQRLCNGRLKSIDASRGDPLQDRLDFREGLLDRIEVRRLGRKVKGAGASCRDGFPHASDLVRGDIVRHDNVSRRKRRRQDLLDIGQKRRPIERAIDRHGRVYAVKA